MSDQLDTLIERVQNAYADARHAKGFEAVQPIADAWRQLRTHIDGIPAPHSTEDRFQHFLAYSQLSDTPAVRYVYFHGANAPECTTMDRPKPLEHV